nr:twin-arginine translocation signal domain-containing protein [Chryseolinea sp.]
MKLSTSRRDFIKTTALASAGFSLLNSTILFAKDKEAKVRLGIIGVGFRGQNHLELALMRNDVEVVAICDMQQSMIDM